MKAVSIQQLRKWARITRKELDALESLPEEPYNPPITEWCLSVSGQDYADSPIAIRKLIDTIRRKLGRAGWLDYNDLCFTSAEEERLYWRKEDFKGWRQHHPELSDAEINEILDEPKLSWEDHLVLEILDNVEKGANL